MINTRRMGPRPREEHACSIGCACAILGWLFIVFPGVAMLPGEASDRHGTKEPRHSWPGQQGGPSAGSRRVRGANAWHSHPEIEKCSTWGHPMPAAAVTDIPIRPDGERAVCRVKLMRSAPTLGYPVASLLPTPGLIAVALGAGWWDRNCGRPRGVPLSNWHPPVSHEGPQVDAPSMDRRSIDPPGFISTPGRRHLTGRAGGLRKAAARTG